MTVDPINNLASNIADMGQALKQINESKLALDDKLHKTVGAELEDAVSANGSVNTYA